MTEHSAGGQVSNDEGFEGLVVAMGMLGVARILDGGVERAPDEVRVLSVFIYVVDVRDDFVEKGEAMVRWDGQGVG